MQLDNYVLLTERWVHYVTFQLARPLFIESSRPSSSPRLFENLDVSGQVAKTHDHSRYITGMKQ
jgi:hypothetical protein